MNRKIKLKKALKVQQKIEGFTPETALLLKLLPIIKTSSQWHLLTTVKHHSYGKLSYETHHFYYPSELLNNLENFFNGGEHDIEALEAK